MEVFIVAFMKVYNKNIITLVTWPDGSDHVLWLRQERPDHTRLRLVWSDVLGAATRRDPTHQGPELQCLLKVKQDLS